MKKSIKQPLHFLYDMKKTCKTKPQKKTKKKHGSHSRVSEKIFWEILESNFGLLQQTATEIQNTFDITYSRQAVASRTKNDIERLNQIREIKVDFAESVLLKNLNSSDGRVSNDSAKFICKTLGKSRGFYEKSEINLSGDQLDAAINRELDRLAGTGKGTTSKEIKK